MAIITKPAVSKGQPATFSLSKAELLQHPIVAADSYFSNAANWYRVNVVYKSSSGKQYEIIEFNASAETPTGSFLVSNKSRNSFQVHKVVILDFDNGFLEIPRSELPVADFDITLTSPQVVQKYRYIKLAVSKLRLNLENPNTVAAGAEVNEFKIRWDGVMHSLNAFDVTSIATPWSQNPNFGNVEENINDGIYSSKYVYDPVNAENEFKDLFSVDLLQPREVQSFELTVNSFWNIPLQYKIYGSTNNTDWTELVSESEPSLSSWQQKGFRKESVINQSVPTYRYVKFSIIRAAGNSSETGTHINACIQEFNLRFDNVTQANLSQFTATELAPPGWFYNSGQSWGSRSFSQIFDGQIINGGAGTEYGFEVTPGVERDLFKLDLGQPRLIQNILLSPQPNFNLPREFKVYASNNQSDWNQILHVNEERWLESVNSGQWTRSYDVFYGANAGFRFLKVAAADGIVNINNTTPQNLFDFGGITIIKNGVLGRVVSITETTVAFPLNAQEGRLLSNTINNSFSAAYIFDRRNVPFGQFSDLFTIDLGLRMTFEKIRLRFGPAWSLPTKYRVFGSRDGVEWKLITDQVETAQSWPNNNYFRDITVSPDIY